MHARVGVRMSRPVFLPSALLDLTLSGVATPFKTLAVFHSARPKIVPARQFSSNVIRRANLATNPPQDEADSVSPNAFVRRNLRHRRQILPKTSNVGLRKPVTELSRRVEALQEVVISEKSFSDLPEFSEDDLLTIYKDLLAHPDSRPASSGIQRPKLSQGDDDISIINLVDQRLSEADSLSQSTPTVRSLANTLRSRHKNTQTSDGAQEIGPVSTVTEPYRRVLSRVQAIVSRIETITSTGSSVVPVSNQDTQRISVASRPNVPVTLLSVNEWAALTRICIRMGDGEAAELSLNLMIRSGIIPSEDLTTQVLESYVNNKNFGRVEQFMANCPFGPPTERQRDLHIKARLLASPADTIPTSALSLLHAYELGALAAPMVTYTRLITALLSVRSSLAHAQAWDLFIHMRYVAHPKPDALLYTLMIRACANSPNSQSEHERALDLWTEMTVENRFAPTVGAYGAIILVCARSGDKVYVNEAFRLAKEMLDSHRDAEGGSAFEPDQRMFCALLEGAKRVGDLARIRWILAEMVRYTDAGGNVKVDEVVMMHVFHGYASYKPPFKRSEVVLVDDGTPPLSGTPGTSSDKTPQNNLPVEDVEPSFSHIPPQTPTELVSEAKSLFAGITKNTGDLLRSGPSRNDADRVASLHKEFRTVKVTPRLINSYLSVHYAHSLLPHSQSLFDTLFEKFGVKRNAYSIVDALQRCGASKKAERPVALVFSRGLWNRWRILEDEWDGGKTNESGVDARMVERAYVAMIRVLTLSDELEKALKLIRIFFGRYPPTAVREPAPPLPDLRSTRTILVGGARPLLRMSSATQIPDDTVPPLLTFSDVSVLHIRLIAAENVKGIDYLKFVSKAYEGALRARRNGAMQAEPLPSDPERLSSDAVEGV